LDGLQSWNFNTCLDIVSFQWFTQEAQILNLLKRRAKYLSQTQGLTGGIQGGDWHLFSNHFPSDCCPWATFLCLLMMCRDSLQLCGLYPLCDLLSLDQVSPVLDQFWQLAFWKMSTLVLFDLVLSPAELNCLSLGWRRRNELLSWMSCWGWQSLTRHDCLLTRRYSRTTHFDTILFVQPALKCGSRFLSRQEKSKCQRILEASVSVPKKLKLSKSMKSTSKRWCW
jgi:hypothetical protein